MSYDVLIGQIDLNITSNITPMTKLGGLYLIDLDGHTGAEAQGRVASCLRYLVDTTNHYKLREVEPSNKWGTLEQTIVFLTRLYFACVDNPINTLTVSG